MAKLCQLLGDIRVQTPPYVTPDGAEKIGKGDIRVQSPPYVTPDGAGKIRKVNKNSSLDAIKN